MTTVEQWKLWTSKGNSKRRRLIVQAINALRLSMRWQAFDLAVQNFTYYGIPPPEEGQTLEAIEQALVILRRCKWSPMRVREEIT